MAPAKAACRQALPGQLLHGIQFIVLVLTTGCFTLLGRRYVVLGDDAMISMRYARNLVEHGVLAWNPADRVEGYTNLLWTLVMVVPHWVRLPDRVTSAAVVLAALVLGLVAIYLTAEVASAVPELGIHAAVAAGLLGASTQLAIWGAGGFETSLLAVCSVGALLAVLRERHIAAGIVLAVGMLTRDDFLPFILVLAFAYWLGAAVDRSRRRATLLHLGLPGVAALAHAAFRHAYYGDLLPNTYHLKVEGWALADRLVSGSWHVLGAAPLLACALAGALWAGGVRVKRGPSRIAGLTLLAAPAVYAGYELWVGGDAFAGTRLFAPVWPLLALGVAALVSVLARQPRRPWLAWVGIAGACSLDVFSPLSFGAVRTLFGYRGAAEAVMAGIGACQRGPVARYCRPAGEGPLRRGFTEASLRPGIDPSVGNLAACLRIREDARQAGLVAPSLATYYAGVPAYFCPEFRAIDLLGKSDRHLAATRAHPGPPGHNKWDYDHSIGGERADYVLSLLTPGGHFSGAAPAGYTGRAPRWEALLESSEFRARCEGHVIDDRVSLVFRCAR